MGIFQKLALYGVTVTVSLLPGIEAGEKVYFGSGCFWARQHSFVEMERNELNRSDEHVTSVVGYAGGTNVGPDGKVCYYGTKHSIYEDLGHAEVVQVDLGDTDLQNFRAFAKLYFSLFKPAWRGMQRLDPQDVGDGYRNVVGLPGGVNSLYFQILKDENVHHMELRESSGDDEDKINVVHIVDSLKLPFNQAEVYHQFHMGMGLSGRYPWSYLSLKELHLRLGKIKKTGCRE